MPPKNKSEAVIAARERLNTCPECGKDVTSIDANSHKTSPDSDEIRLYFCFEPCECIAHTMLADFDAWLESASTDGG